MKKFLTLGFLLPLFLQAYTQTEISLQQAIEYALAHNLEIKTAQLNIADAAAQIEERRSTGLPQISGEVNYNRYLQLPASTLPSAFAELIKIGNGGVLPADFSPKISFIPKHNISAGLNFRTMVFDGSFFTGLKAARTYKDYALEELEAAKQEVRNQVIEAYLPALIIKENQVLLEKNITNLEELYFGTKETYEAGFIEQLEVDRLALILANLATEKDNLARQKEVVINYLKLAIGFPEKEDLIITDDIATLLPVEEEDIAMANDYFHHKKYRVAEAGLQLAELNIEYNKNLYLPSLVFIAGYNQSFQGNKLFGDPNSFWAPSTVVGLSLKVPIFDGLGKKPKIERQRLAYEIAKNKRDQLTQLIDIEVSTARMQYTGAIERLENQKKNLALAEKIHHTTQIKYKEGVGTSLELNQAERDLFDTQRNYTQALYELLVAKMNLNKALGR